MNTMLKNAKLANDFEHILERMYFCEKKGDKYYYCFYSHMIQPLFNILNGLGYTQKELDKHGLNRRRLKMLYDKSKDVEFNLFDYGEKIEFKSQKGKEDLITPFLKNLPKKIEQSKESVLK